jgi:hypothetical protein
MREQGMKTITCNTYIRGRTLYADNVTPKPEEYRLGHYTTTKIHPTLYLKYYL